MKNILLSGMIFRTERVPGKNAFSQQSTFHYKQLNAYMSTLILQNLTIRMSELNCRSFAVENGARRRRERTPLRHYAI
ncbi:hypothetical protein ACFFYR_36630 [Paraburkholderia dipogonis]|uniref:hypothetical protein n=1 Tax=Paraburkholderia dipogonis TaxID=1211383 RepID=UPI00141AD97D|nr:hypothetical protein [Paraburkholderia dipogonis]